MQTNKFGIIGSDDIEEEGYIAHILGVSAEEGDEIIEYLNEEDKCFSIMTICLY
jgi:hypothetical protein